VPLPAPNLDDRRFQQLVDEAKLLVQRRCPEWTDHNVSDPGVTIIEVFAWIADQLVHRLNQVPDRLYLKFLDLLGVELTPAIAAQTEVTFWLSAPQSQVVRVDRGAQAATRRTETEPPVVFTVTEDLEIVPCSVVELLSTIQEGTYRSHAETLQFEQAFACFDALPKPGDALLVGLSAAVPSCAVTLRFTCDIAAGEGVDPRNPPLVWEALAGGTWEACSLDRDDTGGLNRPGDVVLHVPRSHALSTLNEKRAGWLRCRVVDAAEGQPKYGGSPEITGLSGFTSGGTAAAVNAELILDEPLGTSNGLPGQRFRLKNRPVIPMDEPGRVVVSGDDEDWLEVTSFADSTKDDRHFRVDRIAGEIVFGPVVREPDGGLSQYGAVVPANANLTIRAYETGGGAQGNVAAGVVVMLKSAIPYVSRVQNRVPATGGVDGEDVENAKVRGPMFLRGTRAVAARDFEHQAIVAAPNEIARVLCLPAGDGSEAGSVRLLITPRVDGDHMGRLAFDALTPLNENLLEKVAEHIERRRVVGVRVLLEPPLYMGLTVDARVRVGPRSDPELVEEAALQALYRYFNPITGGPDTRGWPFGRPVHAGEAFWVLQEVPGVLFVEQALLHRSNPITGQRGEATERLELEPNALVFSHEHVVTVIAEGESS
jgi:predicted phage baseplate assembly protein